MDICFIILGLFVLIFIGATGVFLNTYTNYLIIKKQDENRENKRDTTNLEKNMWLLSITALVCLGAMMFTLIYMSAKDARAHAELIPETEVIETTQDETISDIPESTSAPDEPIIPDTKKDIHLKDSDCGKRLPPLREAPSDPEPEEIIPIIDPNELEMLACVIYQEAGWDRSCDDCRRYVADVVLNRIEHPQFPNTMEEVLTAQGQYGRFYWTGIRWPDRSRNEIEKHAVDRAYRIAEEVLSGQHSKLYGEGYIWQARHILGSEGFWCCGHWYGR